MSSVEILIVREPVGIEALTPLAEAWHGTLVKGVADLGRGVIALGGEWHMDANTALIADGASQTNVWGFNVYPDERGDKAIEYISLINIRPRQGNKGMELIDATLRADIRSLVKTLIPDLSL